MKAVRAKPGLFRDRREAGRLLAEKLAAYADRSDVLVLALPRGGVPVAYEVARALGAPLDVFVVRKLGVPGYEELAMGAVATGGVRVLNEQLVERLGIPEQMIDAVAARERQELARRVAHVSRQHLVHQHVGCLYGCAADTHCTELLLF
jgi:predicted phosphoribosyltransferase